MAKRIYTEEEEKEIKLLQSSNEMLLQSIERAREKGDERTVERIEIARQDTLKQLAQIDPELVKEEKKTKRKKKSVVEEIASNNDEIETVFDAIQTQESKKKLKSVVATETQVVEELRTRESAVNVDFGNIDSDVQYDIIALPSNGEGYADKKSRVPVAYLTAYDENFLTSPNLYKDGLVIDFLLHNKILDKEVDIDSLYSGDVDAIVLWLRATSYGVEFPITVVDPDSGKRFETTADLSKLKYREFKLKGDENGLFDFELPISKDKVKFKFLTRKDEKDLRMLNLIENDASKSITILNEVDILTDLVNYDKNISDGEKAEYRTFLGKFKEWGEKLKESTKVPINKTITNRMELSIVSINGIDDRRYISKYIRNMGTKDSLEFRKYFLENEPGVDFEIEVERPESLGGGSFKTFLEWNDSVFLNLP